MRFTRLRLNGFKSFVDPTDLIIGRGLTGVVGPNGCGKSNLLEALRWVMGESRAKAMRGGGMDDVIFAGTTSRAARNFAEVSLELDNSERLAPALFNTQDKLDITRRITREAGSAYRVGDKDVRARDVQMLFADASTGSQSPALVRQGQIAELISAKPKSRRRILEEAAGISGLYQRRHESELKLRAAEQNLMRVDDLIEQLATRLSQLGRQAKQAARYREIGADLRLFEGALLLRRWRDSQQAADAVELEYRALSTAAAAAEKAATELEEERRAADHALAPAMEEETIAAALLQRVTVKQEALRASKAQAIGRIKGLERRRDQLARDIDREAALDQDATRTISSLCSEMSDLEQASAGASGALEAMHSALEQASERLGALEASHTAQSDQVARLSAHHQSANRTLADSQKALSRARQQASEAQEARDKARSSRETSHEALAHAQAEQRQAADVSCAAEKALATLEDTRGALQSSEQTARSAAAEAQGSVSAFEAEVRGLRLLVERGRDGSSPILDQVVVEKGFEKALGSALGDDLKAPIATGNGPGWATLAPAAAMTPLPAGARPLSDVTTAPEQLDRRLAYTAVMSREEAEQAQPSLAPGQILVSQDGDLWRWDGLRRPAGARASASALRLEQQTRLRELARELDAAKHKAQKAKADHQTLAAQLAELNHGEARARQARANADKALAEASRAVSRAESQGTLAEGQLESSRIAFERYTIEAREAEAALRKARETLGELEDLELARAQAAAARAQTEEARTALMSLRRDYDQLRHDTEQRARRSSQIEMDLSRWRERQQTAATRSADLVRQEQQIAADLVAAQQEPGRVSDAIDALSSQLLDAQNRSAQARQDLAAAQETARAKADGAREAERTASQAREARAASKARRDSLRETADLWVARIKEEKDVTPDQLASELEQSGAVSDPAERIEARIAKLRQQRDSLGAVNLRAEEDAREISEQHDEIVRDKTDLSEAIETLRAGIASLNSEGRQRLLGAFDQVNENFATLFTHLFGGGEAKLILVESDDPLDAGLEIMCQPPGKKLSTLSLLSGGEQTLTAMALIFAVFLANPAPICVLDEVDAPLDDANVGRFCDMLDEMTRRTDTRFLIITHHAVTMSRMDRLFGVTMQEQGVSQLVSVDLHRAEKMVG